MPRAFWHIIKIYKNNFAISENICIFAKSFNKQSHMSYPRFSDSIFFVPHTDQWNEEYYVTYRYKLSNGDLVQLLIYRPMGYPQNVWTVMLCVGKKKKGYVDGQVTGKGGTEGLVAAKIMIEDVMANLRHGEKLMIFASDERRWRIYKRYLEPLGFFEQRNAKGKALVYEKE